MVKLVNRARVSTATTGMGTVTLGAPLPGYQSFASAGVVEGDVVRYVIEDGINWEYGSGTYTASGPLLSRDVEASSNGGVAITLSGNAKVFVDAVAADLGGTGEFTSFAFEGDGVETDFTLPTSVGATGASIFVFVSGVYQTPTVSYTAVGTTLSFADPPPSGEGANNITGGIFKAAALGETSSELVSYTGTALPDGPGSVSVDGALDWLIDRVNNTGIVFTDRATAEGATVADVVKRIAYRDWAGREVPFVEEPAGASGTAPLTTNGGTVNWIPAGRATPQHFDGDVGDGSADVQAAVEALFDWVNAQGGGDAIIPRGTYPHATPIRFRPFVNVLAEGSSFENATPAVVWDYSGSSYTFYANEKIGAPDLFLGKILHTSATGTNDTDVMHFKKGLSAARINASFLNSGATQNGIIIWGHDPDDNTPNNNSYRTQIQFVPSAGGSPDAPGYAIWYRSDTDALNTRGNAHYIGPATRMNGFTNGVKTNGQGNYFEGVTINDSTGAMFEFEGSNVLANFIVGCFNDANATGDFLKLNNTSANPKDMVTVISPVNRITAANVNDVSTGAGDTYVTCIQSSHSNDPYPGRTQITTIKNGVETNFLPDRFTVGEEGTIALGGQAAAQSTAVDIDIPTSGSTVQNALRFDAKPDENATSVIHGIWARGEGAAAVHTTSDLITFRADVFTLGAGQTVTRSYGLRIDSDNAVGTNAYGVWSNVSSGANQYNFYANGDADNYFAGNVGIGVDPPTEPLDVAGRALFGKIKIGTNALGSATDVELAGNAIIASAGSVRYGAVDTAGSFVWYAGIDDAATGNAGGDTIMELDAERLLLRVPARLNTYTVAEAGLLPGSERDVIYVPDGDAGSPCLAVKVGSDWLRVSLGAAISAT